MDQILVFTRKFQVCGKFTDNEQSIRGNKLAFPVQLQRSFQERTAQIHIQKSAGRGVNGKCEPEHIVISINGVDEPNDLNIGQGIAENRGAPEIVIFAFGAAGEGSSQYGGNECFQIPRDRFKWQLQCGEMLNVIHCL